MMRIAALFIASTLLIWASSQPWKMVDSRQWTSRDVEQVLTNSPWAQSAGAAFALAEDNTPPPPPNIDTPQAGMPSPHNGATDGRWDGGVSRVNRNGPPTLDVTVRWDSALPVRQALERSRPPTTYTPEQIRKDYVITVVGLVPAGGYGRRATVDGTTSDGMDDAARNPEQMLEAMMRNSMLFPRGQPGIRPDDAKLDNATGTVHIFFPRAHAITASDKDVTFQMRFGSLSVIKRFRLKDMMYHGELEL